MVDITKKVLSEFVDSSLFKKLITLSISQIFLKLRLYFVYSISFEFIILLQDLSKLDKNKV